MKDWHKGESIWNLGFLHTYSLTMFFGFLISFLSICYFWHKQKYSWEILQVFLILIAPGSLIGARVWFLISEGGWSQWYILSGLSIQGGVVGAFVFAFPFAWTRRNVIDLRITIGILLPNILIGQAIGRWGNFANHEVFGGIVSGKSLDWMGALKSQMYINGHFRSPLFFYESMSNLFGYLLIVWILLRKNWTRPGTTASMYLIWYGLTRCIMEPMRDESDIMRIGSIPTSLIVAIIMVIIGVITLVYLQFDNKVYILIKPVKTRKLFFIGHLSDEKKKFIFFGKIIPNKVNIWLPNNEEEKKWSKREINKGKRLQ